MEVSRYTIEVARQLHTQVNIEAQKESLNCENYFIYLGTSLDKKLMSSLAKVLKQKKQALLKYREESRLEVSDWNNKVLELYEQIKKWLKTLEIEELLSFEEYYEDIPLLGTKPVLIIKFFNEQTIKFEPILNIVGAYGRIDMILGLHKIMIVLKEKKGDWIFAERYNREEPTLYEFNQDNFEQLVTDFVESFE